MKEKNIYLDEISKISMLGVEEEKTVAELAFSGNKKAQDRLVAANLRFVIKIAQKYRNSGLDLDDLISEGNAGLIEAAKRFDPAKNVRFVTYAVWWIKQSIQKALYEQGKSVKIPLSRPDEYKSDKWNMVSLEKSFGEKEDSVFGDSIADERIKSPEEEFIEKVEKENIRKLIGMLSHKEQEVIKMRYGLYGKEKMSLEAIGDILDYTREGVRQIEGKALKKIKNCYCHGLTAA